MSPPSFLGRLQPSGSRKATLGPNDEPVSERGAAPVAPLATRRYGVDVDGTTVRVVEVVDNVVASFATYQSHTALESFDQFLETRPQGALTVAWSEADFHLRRMPMPSLPINAMRAGLLDAIEETLPMAPGTALVAARVVAARGDGSYSAAVAAAERIAVGEMWQTVQTPAARLVPAPLLFCEDGLYLGLRDGGAHLLLVVGGAAVAARSLAAGGLATVRDALSDGEQSPEERLVTISRGGTRLDPGAAAAVDRYSQAISDEVRRTADFWSRQGLSVPSEIYVHGQGIALPNLAGKLLDAAFLAKAAPMPAVGLDAIARADLPRAYLALLATEFNPTVQVLADLPDPLAAERVRRRSERGRAGRKLAVAAVGAIALAALLVTPVVLARRSVADAEAKRADVDAQLALLRPVTRLNSQVLSGSRAYKQATAADVKWDLLLEQIRESAPAEVSPHFDSISAEARGKAINLTLTATLETCDYEAVARWLRSLAALGAKDPWATTVRCEKAVGGGNDMTRVGFTIAQPIDETLSAARSIDAGSTK